MSQGDMLIKKTMLLARFNISKYLNIVFIFLLVIMDVCCYPSRKTSVLHKPCQNRRFGSPDGIFLLTCEKNAAHFEASPLSDDWGSRLLKKNARRAYNASTREWPSDLARRAGVLGIGNWAQSALILRRQRPGQANGVWPGSRRARHAQKFRK